MTISHEIDRRFIAAAIRLARTNLGLTGTNPSVATLLVKDGKIIGRGVTAIGGRPHAETQAIAEAGHHASASTAYVTLEPCAHHGRTPPCAQALVQAGIMRVVIAARDPDDRVSGKGAKILRDAGIEVVENILAQEAYDGLSGYLTRSLKKRPEVILKLAISADGMIGKVGAGQVAITGDVSRRMVHIMRAQSDLIMIGSQTALADNPDLTCRLPGLQHRCPIRLVLDGALNISMNSNLVRTAKDYPVWLAALGSIPTEKREQLLNAGCRILPCEDYAGQIALPELMDDLGAQGISSVLLEGGARVAQACLDEGLVDRVVLFTSDIIIGAQGIASPLDPANMPAQYKLMRTNYFGNDTAREFQKV